MAIEGLKEDHKARMMVFFSPSDKRKMEDAIGDAKPKPEEISANLVKLIELARKMINQGDLRPEKFDETLLIPEEIENKLAQGQGFEGAAGAAAAGGAGGDSGELSFGKFDGPGGASGGGGGAGLGALNVSNITGELMKVQQTISNLQKENKSLKDENRVLREKLDQIKKIA